MARVSKDDRETGADGAATIKLTHYRRQGYCPNSGASVRRARGWARTRPWSGRCSERVSLSPSQSCPDCTTITSGDDFRKRQGFSFCGDARFRFRRSSAAVATSREGHLTGFHPVAPHAPARHRSAPAYDAAENKSPEIKRLRPDRVLRDSTLVPWYSSPYAPRTGGAYDSHHRTARIASCTRRRSGGRLRRARERSK